MEGMRGRRVAETIKHHLTSSLTREVQDRRLAQLVITAVDVPDDLGVARVFVRLLVGDEDQAARRATLAALGRVSARLRRSLAPRLRLKRVPELKFVYDTGLDHARRVDELLREIADEAETRKQEPEAE